MQWTAFDKPFLMDDRKVADFYRHGDAHLLMTCNTEYHSTADKHTYVLRYENGLLSKKVRRDKLKGLRRAGNGFYSYIGYRLDSFCPITFRSKKTWLSGSEVAVTSQGYVVSWETIHRIKVRQRENDYTFSVLTGYDPKTRTGNTLGGISYIDVIIEKDAITDLVVVSDGTLHVFSEYLPDSWPICVAQWVDARCLFGCFGPEPKTYYGFFMYSRSTRAELIHVSESGLTSVYAKRFHPVFQRIGKTASGFAALNESELWLIGRDLSVKQTISLTQFGKPLHMDASAETVDVLFPNGVLRIDAE